MAGTKVPMPGATLGGLKLGSFALPYGSSSLSEFATDQESRRIRSIEKLCGTGKKQQIDLGPSGQAHELLARIDRDKDGDPRVNAALKERLAFLLEC